MKNIYNSLHEVIKAINPQAGFTIEGNTYEGITWKGETIPISKDDIDAKKIELIAEWEVQEYARNRASAFPSVGDQLDMMMKDKRDGTTTHQEACEAVKAKYPKPE